MNAVERFSLFGEVVESHFAIPAKMDSTTKDPSVRWLELADEAIPAEVERAPAAVTSVELVGSESALRVHRVEASQPSWLAAYTGVADFLIDVDSVGVRVVDPAYEFMVEIRLLGPLSALRAHMRDKVAIHAAVVEIDGTCIALAAGNGGGKTSTTATLLGMGASLVADDLLVIGAEATAESGYPQMRMWVPEAEHFHGDALSLDKVHPHLEKRRVPVGDGFGQFSSGSRRLDAMVFLDRTEGPTVCQRLDPMRAHASLVGHLFLRGILGSLGYAQSAFALCADLVESVPAYSFQTPHVQPDELPGLVEGLVTSLAAR